MPLNDSKFIQNIEKTINRLKDGLDHEVIAYWYRRIEDKSIEIAPKELKDKIRFEQDRILWMKFNVKVSKRAVPYIIKSIDEYLPVMPYSTRLYFQKIQQIIINEMDKDFV